MFIILFVTYILSNVSRIDFVKCFEKITIMKSGNNITIYSKNVKKSVQNQVKVGPVGLKICVFVGPSGARGGGQHPTPIFIM